MKHFAPILLLALAAPMSAAAEENASHMQASTTTLASQQAFYEMRTYYAAPGKFDALNARFRDHTLGLFARHGMINVAYWSQPDVADGKLVYVLAYKDLAARDAAWAAFRADPDWQAAAKASEIGGKLTAKVESVYLKMTDYSPPLLLGQSAGDPS